MKFLKLSIFERYAKRLGIRPGSYFYKHDGVIEHFVWAGDFAHREVVKEGSKAYTEVLSARSFHHGLNVKGKRKEMSHIIDAIQRGIRG